MKFSINALALAISLAPQLLSVVDAAVRSVEDSLQGLPGSNKFAAAEAKLNTYLGVSIQDTEALANVTATVSPLINASVAAFNAAGAFSHKPTAGPIQAVPEVASA